MVDVETSARCRVRPKVVEEVRHDRADRRVGVLRHEPATSHRRGRRHRPRMGEDRADISDSAGRLQRRTAHGNAGDPAARPRTGGTQMNETTMTDFVDRAVEDVGALLGGAMVVIGDKLGLYRAMAGSGPLTPAQVAASTGTAERYVREWLSAQAARGYVTYEGDGHFSLPDEHAVPLIDETSPACVIGAFEIAVGSVYATDTITERFRTGEGFSWGAQHDHVLRGCERFFRPGYLNNLASSWIPALEGVGAKLDAGARVADVGCGHGASTLLLAQTYPASFFVGFDAHEGSITAARKRAAEAGLPDRASF